LKDFLLKGYVLNKRVDRIETKLLEHDQKFDLLIKINLTPKEGIFYDGQIFDAYRFVSDIVKLKVGTLMTRMQQINADFNALSVKSVSSVFQKNVHQIA